MSFFKNNIINFEQQQLSLKIITAMMCFLAILACTVYLLIDQYTDLWSTSIKKELTIRIPYQDKKTLTNEKAKITNVLTNYTKQINFRIMSQEETKSLLSPYLGKDFPINDLPIPTLFIVTLKNIDLNILDKIEREIKKSSSIAIIDDYSQITSKINSIMHGISTISLLCFIFIYFSSSLTCAFAASSSLEVNKKNVTILHLIGASDKFIANEVQNKFLLTCTIGTFFGAIITIAFFFALKYYFTTYSINHLFPTISFSYSNWVAISLIPISLTIICAYAARISVLKQLKKKY